MRFTDLCCFLLTRTLLSFPSISFVSTSLKFRDEVLPSFHLSYVNLQLIKNEKLPLSDLQILGLGGIGFTAGVLKLDFYNAVDVFCRSRY